MALAYWYFVSPLIIVILRISLSQVIVGGTSWLPLSMYPCEYRYTIAPIATVIATMRIMPISVETASEPNWSRILMQMNPAMFIYNLSITFA